VSGVEPKRRTGTGWLALIAIPAVVVVVGLVVFFVWQVRQGKVSPKWKPKATMTNQVIERGTSR